MLRSAVRQRRAFFRKKWLQGDASARPSIIEQQMPSFVAPPASAAEQHAATTYRDRLAELASEARSLQRRHVALGYMRLVCALAILVLIWPAVRRPGPFWLWILLPVAGFVVVAVVHGRVLAALAQTRRIVVFLEHGLARVEDRWIGVRPRTTRLSTAESLYATDLDIFGSGSLFELLCGARTSVGEDRLAEWLLTPAAVEEVKARQRSVDELRSRLKLREALAGAPGPLTANVDREALIAWADDAEDVIPPGMRWLAPLLVLLTLGAVVRFLMSHSPLLLLPLLVLDAGLTFWGTRRLMTVFAGAQKASASLKTLAALFAQLERERFHTPHLQALQGVLGESTQSASHAIARLGTFTEWIEARANYMVRILDAPLLYSWHLAMAVQRWRRSYGRQLRPWLDALGQIEALLSIAAYSFEHPADPFPEFTSGAASFAADELGHPLLTDASCVRNSVSLGGGTQLLLISGSNMSGKSTLLRSVGINAVLAMAGAPVRARRLHLTPLTVAASIHAGDSLQQGQSRFYAEILRIREIAQAARTKAPVLFLLDELLSGTNSADRLTGAQGIVRDLLRSEAIGMLSTHDLALTYLATHSSRVRNVHFEDQIADGKLRFDYRLRDGIVRRSNGVALMRLIGLDV